MTNTFVDSGLSVFAFTVVVDIGDDDKDEECDSKSESSDVDAVSVVSDKLFPPS